MAQFEPKQNCSKSEKWHNSNRKIIRVFVAQFKPKQLAQFHRNGWHISNRNSQGETENQNVFKDPVMFKRMAEIEALPTKDKEVSPRPTTPLNFREIGLVICCWGSRRLHRGLC